MVLVGMALSWTVLVLLSMIFGHTCVVVDGAFGHVDLMLSSPVLFALLPFLSASCCDCAILAVCVVIVFTELDGVVIVDNCCCCC